MRAYHLFIRNRSLRCVCGIPLSYTLNPHPALLRMHAHASRDCAVPFSPSVPPIFTEPRLQISGGDNILAAASMAEIGQGIVLYTPEIFLDSAFLFVDTLDPRSSAHPGEFTLPPNRESQLLAPYHRREGGAARGLVVLHPGDSFLIRTSFGTERSVQFTETLTWKTARLARRDALLFWRAQQ